MTLLERVPRDLDRILRLPERAVVDCERNPRTRLYTPATQALVDVVTARYSRGPRLSCGCRDRLVRASGGGRVLIFGEGRPGEPPLLPVEATVDAFCTDSAHDPDAVQIVSGLCPGQEATLRGLGRPCILSLNAPQAWVLREAPRVGGILGFLSIGSGKTLASILVPLAFPSVRSAVVLAKPDQRLHYRNAYLQLREHFRVPSIIFDQVGGSYIVDGAPALHFVPYSILQQMKNSDLLERYAPDLIVADEAHCLSAAPRARSAGSTRARRFLKYMTEHGDTRFCCWSGSLVNKSLQDMTHLAAHALGLNSPYPILPDDVEAWSAVIDPSRQPDTTSSTALALIRAFGKGKRRSDVSLLVASNDDVRDGLRRKAMATPGVVSTRSASVTCSIVMHAREVPPLPEVVKEALKRVRNEWIRPDDQELVEAMEKVECAKHVASGFYHKWFYKQPKCSCIDSILQDCPGCQTIKQWFAARKRWARELRQKLLRSERHMDSEALCANAAERAWREPRYDGPLPVWPAESWPAWAEVKDLVEYESRAVWLDDFLARDAVAWGKEHTGIIWYESRALGLKVSQLGDFPHHPGGPGAEARILAEKGDKTIVASISSHSEGRDGLQYHFSKQYILEPMASGKAWDQLMGRTARQGQPEDTIETWVALHVEENRDALRKAIELAEFDQGMSPNASLLLASDMSFDL